MDFSKRKEAISLLKEVRKADKSGASDDELYQILREGNNELLFPDGTDKDASLTPEETTSLFRLLMASLLLPTKARTLKKEGNAVTKRIIEVIEITRDKYGVILRDETREWCAGHWEVLKQWIYPKKESEQKREFGNTML